MRTHYHDGQGCNDDGCAILRDVCGFRDGERGPCTLNAGHSRQPFESDGGHLFFGVSVGAQGHSRLTDDQTAAANIAAGRLSIDDGGVIDLGDVLRMGDRVIDHREIGVSGPEPSPNGRGIPSHPTVPVRPAAGRTAGFSVGSEEDIRAAGDRIAAVLRTFGEQVRESMTGTASSRALVSALIERAKTETPADVFPLSAAAIVDDVCEALRASGLLQPADLTVIRTVIVHLMRAKR